MAEWRRNENHRQRDDAWADERRAQGYESGSEYQLGRGEQREIGPHDHGHWRDREHGREVGRGGGDRLGSQRSDWGRGSSDHDDYGRGSYRGSDFGRSRYGAGDYDAMPRSRGGSGGDFSRSDYGRDWSLNQTRNYAEGDYRANRGRDWAQSRDEWNRYGQERGFLDRATDEISSWFGDQDAERRRRQDQARDRPQEQRGEQRATGRGPKNYTRSSDRIREDICDRFSSDWNLDATEVDVTVSGNEVTLSGTVPTRDQRRRAEDVAEQVLGVTHVQNNLRVKSGHEGSYNATSEQGGHGIRHGAASTGQTGSAGTTASPGVFTDASTKRLP